MACRISLSVTLRLLFCISLIVACLLGIINNAPVIRSQSRTINSTEDSTLSCYHPDAGNIHLIVKLMNGETINQRSNYSDIIYLNCFHSESNTLRYTVTIPSRPGAQVFCHALFDDPQESLPNLTLTTTSRRTMNVSVGEVAVFQGASCSRIDWLVNNTHLNRLLGTGYSRDINVTTSLAADGSTRISTLHILARLIYNNTLIEYRAQRAPEHLPAVSLFVYQRQCQENITVNSYLIFNNNKTVEVFLTAHINLDSSYHVYKSIVQLDSLDGLSPNHLEVTIVPRYHDQTLTSSVKLTLPHRRIWNVTVTAYCEFAAFELSTHDIQNISVHSPSPGHVTIALDFLQGSTATDILTILYRRSDSHVLYDLAPRIPSTRNAVVNITGIDSGAHDVFVYAVEGNGTYSLATVEPQSITVDSLDKPPPSDLPLPKIEYETQMTSSGFKIAVIDGTRRSRPTKPTEPTMPTSNTPHWIIGLVVGGSLLLVLCLVIIAGSACIYNVIKRTRRQAPESGSQSLSAREGSLQLSPAHTGGLQQPGSSPQPSQHVEIKEESPHDDVSPESDEGQTFKTITSEQETRKNVIHRKDDRKLSVKRDDIALGEKDSGDNSIASTGTIIKLHSKQMEYPSMPNLVSMDIQSEQDTVLTENDKV